MNKMPSEHIISGEQLLKAYKWSASTRLMLDPLLILHQQYQKSDEDTVMFTPEIVLLGILNFGQQRIHSPR